MGMQASPTYRMRYAGTLEAQSTGEDTILRKQGLSYLHYTARRDLYEDKGVGLFGSLVFCVKEHRHREIGGGAVFFYSSPQLYTFFSFICEPFDISTPSVRNRPSSRIIALLSTHRYFDSSVRVMLMLNSFEPASFAQARKYVSSFSRRVFFARTERRWASFFDCAAISLYRLRVKRT